MMYFGVCRAVVWQFFWGTGMGLIVNDIKDPLMHFQACRLDSSLGQCQHKLGSTPSLQRCESIRIMKAKKIGMPNGRIHLVSTAIHERVISP